MATTPDAELPWQLWPHQPLHRQNVAQDRLGVWSAGHAISRGCLQGLPGHSQGLQASPARLKVWPQPPFIIVCFL